VRPHSDTLDKLGVETRKKDVKTFVKEVRDAIEMVEREEAAKDPAK
jgi:ribosomal protein S20